MLSIACDDASTHGKFITLAAIKTFRIDVVVTFFSLARTEEKPNKRG